VQFVTYARNAADVSPEGLHYVSAANSSTGQALLALTNEVSSTLTVYGLTTVKSGGVRNDQLMATDGIDELTGGAGADRFVFAQVRIAGDAGAARDVITDFVSGQDKIHLARIDANSTKSGNQAWSLADAFSGRAGELTITREGDDLLLSGDVNGDGRADLVIELTGASTLKAADIVL
jgi:Ca2+-binding RTX toxin-like protein